MKLFPTRLVAFVCSAAMMTACSNSSSTPALSSIWVTAWGAPLQPAAANAAASSEQTFRIILKPTVGSRGPVRVHLSNLLGKAPVTVGGLHIGIAGGGASVAAGTDAALTFSGTSTVTLPAGATIYSDAVSLPFSFGALLAVTAYVTGTTTAVPRHNGYGQIVDYATASGAGNQTADLAGTSFTAAPAAVLVDRVDLSGNYSGTVAFAGSSTTAGFGTPGGSYSGLIDDVAANLHAAGRDDLALANMSIVPDSLLPKNDLNGDPSVLERLSSDFLSLPSIRTIVQNAADIDLKSATCDTATDIIAGNQQLIAQAHAAHVRVVLAVVAPATFCQKSNPSGFGSRFAAGSGQDGQRELLNAWIVSTAPSTVADVSEQPPGADAVVDIATPVTDPANTGYLLPLYDSGDNSHVTAAGQALQAAAIPTSVL